MDIRITLKCIFTIMLHMQPGTGSNLDTVKVPLPVPVLQFYTVSPFLQNIFWNLIVFDAI